MTLESALQRNRTIVDSLELLHAIWVSLFSIRTTLYPTRTSGGVLAHDLVQDEDKGRIVGGESRVIEEMERSCESLGWTSSQILREERRAAIKNPRYGRDSQ